MNSLRNYIIFLFFLFFNSYSLFSESKKDYTHEEVIKEEKNFSIELRSIRFAPGNMVFLKFIPKNKQAIKKENLKISWNQIEYKGIKNENHFTYFLPVHPDFKNKIILLEIYFKKWFGYKKIKSYEVEIGQSNFIVKKIQKINLPKSFTNKVIPKETLDFIKECERIKSEVFKSESDATFSGGFVYPTKHVEITSPFYIRRDYNTGKKGRPHGGVDFRGKTGTPIHAIHDGKVVLAQRLFYEGIFTVIDHGNKIFSFYMHQSETKVNKGDFVKKNQLIGSIGSTGMSTGPHLHLGIKISGILVDPLSLIRLPME